jgi:hypothetical protein
MSHQKSNNNGNKGNKNHNSNFKKSFHTSLNPSTLSKYFGLVKNFSPIQKNLNNKLSLKKKPQESNNNTLNNKNNNYSNNKKNVQTNNYFQTSSQFLKYKTLKPYLNKTSNSKTFKSINTNNYIINTLNLSEKKIINTSIEPQNETVDFDSNYKKLKKEKEELEKKVLAQKKLIQKLIQENEKLDNKFNEVYEENCKLRNTILSYKDTQEQLIILIKLVQKTGVDVEEIIDKWNNEVENENNNNSQIILQDKDLSYHDLKDNNKFDSFTPIIINDSNNNNNKKKYNMVPKLNFSNLDKRIQNNQLRNEKNEENKIKAHKKNLSQGDIEDDDNDKLQHFINQKNDVINMKKKSPKKLILKGENNI